MSEAEEHYERPVPRCSPRGLGFAVLLTLGLTGCRSNSSGESDRTPVNLDCQAVALQVSFPDTSEVEVLGDAVGLQTASISAQPLQTAPVEGSTLLFAKSGLWLRGGTTGEVSVPPALADKLWIQWGNAESERATAIRFADCTADAPWLGFAGGFYVKKPMCADLEVRTGDRFYEVSVGIGAPCPGQVSPPTD